MAQQRRPSPQCAVLALTCLEALKDKITSFDVKPDSPMLWTIRHAAWVLTRYNKRRDTRTTPYEKIRGQKYRKIALPLGEQVLARRLGANDNQLLQQWVTAFGQAWTPSVLSI